MVGICQTWVYCEFRKKDAKPSVVCGSVEHYIEVPR